MPDERTYIRKRIMKTLKILLLALAGIVANLNLTSCGDDYYYNYDRDCVGTWWITFDYDNWGNYSDGGIMVLYANGRYDYYYSDRDYRYDLVGYYGRWWTDRGNLLYTYGNDTYSYRIVSSSFDAMRLRNNLPPGDTEIWYRY